MELKKAMGIFLGLGGLSRRRLQMAQSDLGYRRDDEVLENVMRKATTGRNRPGAAGRFPSRAPQPLRDCFGESALVLARQVP